MRRIHPGIHRHALSGSPRIAGPQHRQHAKKFHRACFTRGSVSPVSRPPPLEWKRTRYDGTGTMHRVQWPNPGRMGNTDWNRRILLYCENPHIERWEPNIRTARVSLSGSTTRGEPPCPPFSPGSFRAIPSAKPSRRLSHLEWSRPVGIGGGTGTKAEFVVTPARVLGVPVWRGFGVVRSCFGWLVWEETCSFRRE